MRPSSSNKLRACVSDFLDSMSTLPFWVSSSSDHRQDRGHYEWGTWNDSMRSSFVWMVGGPWRTIVADVQRDCLLSSTSEFHKLKDQLVWEIIDQAYHRAEAKRQSTATEETAKTRIRSVFSWQRRHDVKKHSLIWFLDFAFTLSAYSEFQGQMLFSKLHSISILNLEDQIPFFSPSQFGQHAHSMENQMFRNNFIPFYCRHPSMTDNHILIVRKLSHMFCHELSPPAVEMNKEVVETRGMPREDKAVDFMSPWLVLIEKPEHDQRWNIVLRVLVELQSSISNFNAFKAELCRQIVMMMLSEITNSGSSEIGFIYDIMSLTANEQSEIDLVVRSNSQKKRRMAPRLSLRSVLEHRLESCGVKRPSFPSTTPMEEGIVQNHNQAYCGNTIAYCDEGISQPEEF